MSQENMRALNYKSYGGLENMQLNKLPLPVIAEDEVLVRVYYASINPYDKKLREGNLSDFFDVDFPVIPGRDGYGEIVAIGKNAAWQSPTKLEIGQGVCFLSSSVSEGSLAEFVTVKALSHLAPSPKNLTPEQCAALPLIGVTAYCALVETAALTKGMRVLIHGGSGGVGLMAIQLARYIGAEVFTTCSSENIKLVESFGAVAIPYNSMDFVNVLNNYDVVMDTIGAEVHEKSYLVLKKGGCLVYLIAKPFKDVSADFDVETKRVMVMEKTDSFTKMLELASTGVFCPNVSDTFSLNDFAKAFKMVENRKAKGKVVIKIKGENYEK